MRSGALAKCAHFKATTISQTATLVPVVPRTCPDIAQNYTEDVMATWSGVKRNDHNIDRKAKPGTSLVCLCKCFTDGTCCVAVQQQHGLCHTYLGRLGVPPKLPFIEHRIGVISSFRSFHANNCSFPADLKSNVQQSYKIHDTASSDFAELLDTDRVHDASHFILKGEESGTTQLFACSLGDVAIPAERYSNKLLCHHTCNAIGHLFEGPLEPRGCIFGWGSARGGGGAGGVLLTHAAQVVQCTAVRRGRGLGWGWGVLLRPLHNPLVPLPAWLTTGKLLLLLL